MRTFFRTRMHFIYVNTTYTGPYAQHGFIDWLVSELHYNEFSIHSIIYSKATIILGKVQKENCICLQVIGREFIRCALKTEDRQKTTEKLHV